LPGAIGKKLFLSISRQPLWDLSSRAAFAFSDYKSSLEMRKHNIRTFVLFSLALTVCVAVTNCGSLENYEADRRQRLLEIYPLGTTTRAEVQQKWGQAKWDFSETRPAAGWGAATNRFVGDRALISEQRTGQPVHRIEGQLAPDGLSGSLCRCWFYYDKDDRLVDVDWQWHTD
jgi:hypothetical protein